MYRTVRTSSRGQREMLSHWMNCSYYCWKKNSLFVRACVSGTGDNLQGRHFIGLFLAPASRVRLRYSQCLCIGLKYELIVRFANFHRILLPHRSPCCFIHHTFTWQLLSSAITADCKHATSIKPSIYGMTLQSCFWLLMVAKNN